MEKKVLTERQKRERKFLLLLPAFAFPLLTGMFWILGGGKGRAELTAAAGFLMRLPGAHVKPVTRLDKMGYYELARHDSAAERQKLNVQANYARQLGLDAGIIGWEKRPGVAAAKNSIAVEDPNVQRVREKLEELKKAVAGKSLRPERDSGDPKREGAGPERKIGVAAPSMRKEIAQGPDVGKLEKVIKLLQRDEGGDSEMQQLSAVLDKLAAMQRPREDSFRRADGLTMKGAADGVVRGAADAAVVKRQVLTVRALPEEDDTVGGFDSSVVEAIIPEEVVLVSGGELRMELAKDVAIGRQRVAAGTALFGTASLSGERLRVVISAIAVQGRVLPLGLEVDDVDGLPGIYIPGAPVPDALRESAGQELGSLGSGVVTTGLAGQAAGAGVVLARSLMGKKLRPVKVTIPAGYRILLHVKNQAL